MLLLIDNYDSFVFNLARYFERLGQETHVVRNDAVDVAAIQKLRPAAIVLSPGPCTPNEAGCSLDVVQQLYTSFPMLGVCLGHQTIGMAFGANVVRAQEPVHGRASQVFHRGENLFAGVPNPFWACRYHSLVVEESSLPADLLPTAWCDGGTLMAIAHSKFPVFGVQFHPESILTENGYALLANFLQLAGISGATSIPPRSSELVETAADETNWLNRVVTF